MPLDNKRDDFIMRLNLNFVQFDEFLGERISRFILYIHSLSPRKLKFHECEFLSGVRKEKKEGGGERNDLSL